MNLVDTTYTYAYSETLVQRGKLENQEAPPSDDDMIVFGAMLSHLRRECHH